MNETIAQAALDFHYNRSLDKNRGLQPDEVVVYYWTVLSVEDGTFRITTDVITTIGLGVGESIRSVVLRPDATCRRSDGISFNSFPDVGPKTYFDRLRDELSIVGAASSRMSYPDIPDDGTALSWIGRYVSNLRHQVMLSKTGAILRPNFVDHEQHDDDATIFATPGRLRRYPTLLDNILAAASCEIRLPF